MGGDGVDVPAGRRPVLVRDRRQRAGHKLVIPPHDTRTVRGKFGEFRVQAFDGFHLRSNFRRSVIQNFYKGQYRAAFAVADFGRLDDPIDGKNLHRQRQLLERASHVEDVNADSKELVGIPFESTQYVKHARSTLR